MFKKEKIIIPNLDKVFLDEYLAIKEAQTVIYNDEIDIYLEKPDFREYVESEQFMEILTEFVIRNYLSRTMDESVKQNIITTLDYLKYNKEYKSRTNKSELFTNINEIIGVLNSISDENSILFYRDQFCKRTDQKRTDFLDLAYDEKFMKKHIASLNYSISYDFEPLYDLSQVESEQEFMEEVVPDNLVTHYFINTLNVLFSEMPGLYSDEKFVARAKIILENNILLVKGKPSAYQLNGEGEIDRDLLPRTKKVLKKLKRISR